MSWRQQVQFFWRGVDGSTKISSLHTLDNPAADLGAAGDIKTTAEALSHAVIDCSRLMPAVISSGDPTAGAYANCKDYVVFQFRSAAGEVTDVIVPSPLESILAPSGGRRIDFSNASVLAFVAAVIDGAASSSGSPFVECISGERDRTRKIRLF